MTRVHEQRPACLREQSSAFELFAEVVGKRLTNDTTTRRHASALVRHLWLLPAIKRSDRFAFRIVARESFPARKPRQDAEQQAGITGGSWRTYCELKARSIST